jgi:Domain of unknown function (DUF4258)
LKPLRFTDHAEVRIARRGLQRDWIETAAMEPDWREPEPGDPEVERRFRRIDEAGGRILRVACAETETEIRVIIAMFDRNAKARL